MKLNMDCVRDVLLELEKETEFRSDFSYRPILAGNFCRQFEKYAPHEVYHTLLKLEEAGYIYVLNSNPKNMNQPHNPQYMEILDLTFSGGQFLSSIKNQSVWNKISPFASGLTFDMIKRFAWEIISKNLPL